MVTFKLYDGYLGCVRTVVQANGGIESKSSDSNTKFLYSAATVIQPTRLEQPSLGGNLVGQSHHGASNIPLSGVNTAEGFDTQTTLYHKDT